MLSSPYHHSGKKGATTVKAIVSLIARTGALVVFANNYRQRYSSDAQWYKILDLNYT